MRETLLISQIFFEDVSVTLRKFPDIYVCFYMFMYNVFFEKRIIM